MSTVLPPEIWREVFLLATHVPGLLTTTWLSDPDEALWGVWKSPLEEEFEASMEIKKTIVQVCREWKALGTEFLYEAVHIRYENSDDDYSRVDELVAILRASCAAHVQVPVSADVNDSDQPQPLVGVDTGSSKRSNLGYGWWIKRIECPDQILYERNFQRLEPLLSLCHNLAIFAVSDAFYIAHAMANRLFSILESRFFHSLRRLDIKAYDMNELAVLLPSIPLSSLDLCLPTPEFALNPACAALSTITSLTLSLPEGSFVYPESLHFHKSFYFPTLRHLGLLHVADSNVEALKALVAQHSATVVSLYFNAQYTCYEFSHLLHLATNLRTLTIDDDEFLNLAWQAPHQPFTGITNLAIYEVNNGQEFAPNCLNALQIILGGSVFPDLKILRLLNRSNRLSGTKEWSEMGERCANVGLKLQDGEGQTLVWSNSYE